MYVRLMPVFVFVAVLALLLAALPVRAQTMQNPGFETWVTPNDPTNWMAVQPAAQQMTPRSGTWALTVKPFGSVSQDVTISQPGYLLLAVWVRSGTTSVQLRLSVGNVASCQIGSPTTGAEWQQVTCGGVVSPGSVRVVLANAQFSGTAAVVLDDASVTFTANTAMPTLTNTATATATSTSTSTATATPTSTSTATPTATATSTTTPTATEVPPTPTPFLDLHPVAYCPIALR